MKRLLATAALLVGFSMPTMAGDANLPPLQAGAHYLDVRPQLLEQGWKPDPSPDADPYYRDDRETYGVPELDTCSGTGEGPCIFNLKNGWGWSLRITTVGGNEYTLRDWNVFDPTRTTDAAPAQQDEDQAANDNQLDGLNLDLGNLVSATCYVSPIQVSGIAPMTRGSQGDRIPREINVTINLDDGSWSVNGSDVKPIKVTRGTFGGIDSTVISASAFMQASNDKRLDAMGTFLNPKEKQEWAEVRSKLLGGFTDALMANRYALFAIEGKQLFFFTYRDGQSSGPTGVQCL